MRVLLRKLKSGVRRHIVWASWPFYRRRRRVKELKVVGPLVNENTLSEESRLENGWGIGLGRLPGFYEEPTAVHRYLYVFHLISPDGKFHEIAADKRAPMAFIKLCSFLTQSVDDDFPDEPGMETNVAYFDAAKEKIIEVERGEPWHFGDPDVEMMQSIINGWGLGR